jgi:hypothetical protein
MSNVHSYLYNKQIAIEFETEVYLRAKESFTLSELFYMSVEMRTISGATLCEKMSANQRTELQ